MRYILIALLFLSCRQTHEYSGVVASVHSLSNEVRVKVDDTIIAVRPQAFQHFHVGDTLHFATGGMNFRDYGIVTQSAYKSRKTGASHEALAHGL